MYQEIPLTTSGNQKCRGAAPIFINRAKFKRGDLKLEISKNLEYLKLAIKIIEKIKVAEAMAWVIKYFKEASAENLFLNDFIKGIRDKRLISNPIQAVNQEVAEIEMIVPKIKLKENIIL